MAKDESLMASPAPALPLDESVDDEMVQLGPEARKILSQVEAELRGAQGPLFQQCLTALVDWCEWCVEKRSERHVTRGSSLGPQEGGG